MDNVNDFMDDFAKEYEKKCKKYNAKFPEGFVDFFNLYFCGLGCSPHFKLFVSEDGIAFCAPFVDRLWNSIKDVHKIEDDECTEDTLSDEYDDGEDYADALGIIYDKKGTPDEDCFNAAASFAPSALLVGVAATAVAALFF